MTERAPPRNPNDNTQHAPGEPPGTASAPDSTNATVSVGKKRARVAVWPDKKVRGWNGELPSKAKLWALFDLRDALHKIWPTDAHFVPYRVVGHGAQPRINRAALPILVSDGVDIVYESIALDIDDPLAHAADRASDDAWRNDLLAAVAPWPHRQTCALYFTRRGVRLVWELGQAVTTEQYLAILAALRADLESQTGLVADRLVDWNRCYRLAFVVRDGVPQTLPADFSGLEHGPLDVESLGLCLSRGTEDNAKPSASKAEAGKKPPTQVGTKEVSERPDAVDSPDIIYRFRCYLEKMGPSFQGEKGDNHALDAACQGVRGFNLTDDATLKVLMEWNETCEPPFEEDELRAKIQNAHKHGSQPYGQHLDTDVGFVQGLLDHATGGGKRDAYGIRQVDHIKFPHRRTKGPHAGKPHPGYTANTQALLDAYGAEARYNLMTHTIEIAVDGLKVPRERARNAEISWFRAKCHRHSLNKETSGEHIHTIARNYHPALDWIESTPWDGKDRVTQFVATVKSTDVQAASLVRKWLVQCAVAVLDNDNFSPSGVLVLQGQQGCGKTMWVASLAPPEMDLVATGMLLDPRARDSVQQVTSYWITELSELDATFRRADIAAIKAIVNRRKDVYRSAYARKAEEIPRRTCLVATCNRPDFLADDTGNRRWWTIRVKSCNWRHGIEMQQMWAQVLAMAKAGAPYHLTDEEERFLTASNQRFEIINPLICDLWDTWEAVPRSDMATGDQVPLVTVADIYRALPGCLGAMPSRRDSNEIVAELRRLGITEKRTSRKRNVGFALRRVGRRKR